MNRPLRLIRQLASGVGGRSPRFREQVASGDKARDARDWERAIAHYESALEINPADLGIGVQLGHCLKETGRFAEAETRYLAFAGANPNDADIQLQLGQLAMRRGRVEEAGRWYQQAAKLAPAESVLAIEARRGLELCADALRAPRGPAAMAPVDRRRFADAYPKLSTPIEEPGRLDGARAGHARRLTLPDGDSPDLRFDIEFQLGHVAKISRDYAEALGHYTAAQRLLPQTQQPGSTQQELEAEIKLCLGHLTSAITLA
jgi:tetratricopeptide (TPR) repeat protein